MLNTLFTPNPDAEQATSIRPRKGVIIGAGQVGMACAYSLIIQDCFDELVLQDVATERVVGEVMDLAHGIPFISPTNIQAGTVADVGRNADVVIITAGAAQQPGESRLSLVERNVEIFQQILPSVVDYCPGAVLLVVSNPVDIMTTVTLRLSGFPSARVIGSGTVLDTARFRSVLAYRLGVDPRSVHAYIIGEHGDSEVPVWSTAHVGGAKLLQTDWQALSAEAQAELTTLFEQVKNAAYEIIQRKGFTAYAIGLAVTHIVKAILRGQERILTVSSLVQNFYDIQDICLSLPSVVSEQGVIKTVNLRLSSREVQALQQSAQTLKAVFAKLKI
ncbi:MAG: L-lactate dehydrogenase [Leptolyngbya sp. SIO4C1]|nr:L-lactate dehydrogenase [Leptolyngbya sp. SIO4C1]